MAGNQVSWGANFVVDLIITKFFPSTKVGDKVMRVNDDGCGHKYRQSTVATVIQLIASSTLIFSL